MSTNEKIAHAVAVAIVVAFLVALAVALFVEDRTVPKEGYPLVTIALGYLLGYQVHRNGKTSG